MTSRKVLLLELNEVTWTVMDRLIAQGLMPNLARLRREGLWASPTSVDEPPHLDPWVTWVTLHTGVDRSVHGATVLGQPGPTITAKRTWDYVVDAGKSVGVFGSISAYPPRPVPGFIVPGPFAPGPEVYPAYLSPIQALNRRYTKVHNKLASEHGKLEMVRDGIELMKLGLKPATCARIMAQLARERIDPNVGWRRVTLQPLVNYDFFETLYQRYRPDFATWHTNHCAHFMHHYWRAWDDSPYPVKSTPEERHRFGGALPYGHALADELIGKFMRLVDDDTVLVMASSMGQQPYVQESYTGGRVVVRFTDVHRFLELLGIEGISAVEPAMAPQWNVTIADPTQRQRAIALLTAGRRTHHTTAPHEAVSVSETGDILTITPKGLAEAAPDAMRYHFPGTIADRAEGYRFEELFAADNPTRKQGCHHPVGSLVLWGKSIAPGHVENSTNLDIAPTILSLMDIPVPSLMTGRPLHEVQAPARAAE